VFKKNDVSANNISNFQHLTSEKNNSKLFDKHGKRDSWSEHLSCISRNSENVKI